MTIKSLLAAVSMVALTAGSASALTIPSTTPTGVVLASELLTPLDGIGNVQFSVETESGDYPGGNNFIVDIILPTGVGVDGPVSGSVVVGPAGATAVVQNQTGNTIQLFVSIPQTGGINSLDFDLPLELLSCDVSGDLVVNVKTEGGTDVEDGTASADSPIAPCESAFSGMIQKDAGDSIIALDDYEMLRSTPTGAAVSNTVIGQVKYEIDPTIGVDLAGTPLTAADVDEVTFDVVFQDGGDDAFTNVVIGGASGSILGSPSTDNATWSFDLDFDGDLSDGVWHNIGVVVAGDEEISSQPMIFVENAVVEFDTSTLIATEAGATGMLDGLDREGQTFGVFDWNSGPAGGQTDSVYRVTGLTPGLATRVSFTTSNSGNDVSFSKVLTADAAGELVISAIGLAADIPSDVKRFDLGLNFETGNDVDVDRLMAKGGNISYYGGGANGGDVTLEASPGADADN